MKRAIAIFCLLVGEGAWAQPFLVREHSLANGMKVLIHEDHDIPTAALYLFFRVGSRNEKPGITGLSHFLEHMMFNGTGKYERGEFDRVMEANGGSNNAYTTRDVTVYTDWFMSPALELAFELEADRLQNLRFAPDAVESERRVVASERRSTVENDNFSLLLERLYAAAYRVHPYRWPVIGWDADIKAWTLDDLERHFRMGYAPANSLLVLVGDVHESEVLALAGKHFTPIPSHAPASPVNAREPEQTEERRVVVRKPAQLPLQVVAYHVPAAAHPDHWPLEVLSAVLSWGRSSRLHRRLVRQEGLALSVSCWKQLSLDPGLLLFSLEPKKQAHLGKLERAFFDELDRVQTTAISSRELTSAKNQLLTAHLREMRTNSGKAELLGRYEIFFGNYRRLFRAAEELGRVTAAEVHRVAKLYLRPANRTIATLVPEAAHPQEVAR